MLRTVVTLALLVHGVGHAVGFWMPVPQWLALAWLAPGLVFVGSAWGARSHAAWWPTTATAAAVVSMAILFLQPATLIGGGPFASGFAFDLVVLAALLLPWTRRSLAAS